MTRDTIEPRLDTYHFYEDEWAGYDDLRESFEWEIPDRFNMATYVLDRWATTDPDRVAIYGNDQDRVLTEYTYRDLERAASQLANYLESQGIGRGDRVAVNGSQKAELLIGHLAAWKLGAISVPLSILFGPEGLGFRLDDSGAKAYVVDSGSLGALREIRGDLDALETVVTVDADPGVDEVSFEDAITDQPDSFETVDTNAEDVAMLIYTSGTTGPPKGVAHAHRGILGILPGFAMSICNMEITDDDVARGPVEWSWAGSLNDLILPCLYYGIPIVAHARGEFDPVAEFELLDDFDVTVTGGPATVYRMMMQVPDPASKFDLSSLRCMVIGGEALGDTIVDWATGVFDDLSLHEVYGQTEAPLFVGDCEALGLSHESGYMGKPLPGHDVAVFDVETRERLGAGEVGEIALWYEDDPEVFTEFWNNPEQTQARIHNGWLLTDDMGSLADDGRVSFHSRKDDVIISAGYRIGPEEIEDAISSHEAVADAGVIGVPDDTRGEIPKAYVTLREGVDPTDALAGELQEYVKERLAKYEYPREIEFIDELPLTTTGKVRRLDLRRREGIAD